MGSLEVYTEASDVVEACKQARKARLFVPGWNLFGTYVHAMENPEMYAICFYVEDGVKLGVGIVELDSDWDEHHYMQVFVRHNQRKQGIGRQIVEKLCTIKPDFEYGEGSAGSLIFWEKVTNKGEGNGTY